MVVEEALECFYIVVEGALECFVAAEGAAAVRQGRYGHGGRHGGRHAESARRERERTREAAGRGAEMCADVRAAPIGKGNVLGGGIIGVCRLA